MVVENIQLEGNLVIYTPVCCTANLSLQAINNFLSAVHAQDDAEKTPATLILIDALQTHYTGPTQELRGDPRKILRSPFTDFTYHGVKTLLDDLKADTGSPLETNWFLVLDEQSERTETAVIVRVNEQDEAKSLRVEYASSSRYLSAASIAHPPLDELIEIASDTKDGVLRD